MTTARIAIPPLVRRNPTDRVEGTSHPHVVEVKAAVLQEHWSTLIVAGDDVCFIPDPVPRR
jgi:hypothetical protein